MAAATISYWPAAVMSLVLLFTTYTFQKLPKTDPNSNLPRIGDGDLQTRWTNFLGEGSWDMYREGYRKFKGRAFKITDASKRDRIVLPHTLLPELARYPDEVISQPELAAENVHAEYTLKDSSTPAFRRVLVTQLTPALSRVTSALREGVVEAMASDLPSSSEWTETTIKDKFMNIIAKSSGRVLIGPECCNDPTYFEGALNFQKDLAAASKAISKVPWILRPIIAPRLAATKQVHRRIQDFSDILGPVIEERQRQAEAQGSDYQRPDDMTQWMIDSVPKTGAKEVTDIALEQSMVSFAAVNSTNQHTSLALFHLAADQKLAAVLLEEVNQVLEESGGEWTNLALQNMKKIDSFLREVGRYDPFTAASFARKVMKPVTLSNGMHIPKNTVIEVDWYGITRDEAIYPNPEEFDALRFYKLRQECDKSSQSGSKTHQYVNVSPTSLTWNYGKRACPGRFFASNMEKLIIATLLLRYEIRNVEGVEGRAENFRGAAIQTSFPHTKVQIRKK